MTRTTLTVLVTAVLCGVNTQALMYDAGTDGTTAPAGMSFTAWNGNLGLKTVAGYTGLGVTGRYSGNEIDVRQSLTIDFDSPQYVESLVIAFLYDGPEFNDPNEVARVATDVYPTFYLTATGETSATWTGAGSVVNVSPASATGGGVWRIDNPFAGNVSQIKLSPKAVVSGYGQDSDFSLHLIKTSDGRSISIPDGGSTLVLFGLALCAVGVAGRGSKQ